MNRNKFTDMLGHMLRWIYFWSLEIAFITLYEAVSGRWQALYLFHQPAPPSSGFVFHLLKRRRHKKFNRKALHCNHWIASLSVICNRSRGAIGASKSIESEIFVAIYGFRSSSAFLSKVASVSFLLLHPCHLLSIVFAEQQPLTVFTTV